MSNFCRQTVFIVDDDACVLDSIRELVESVGMNAECFSSAHAFLKVFRPLHRGCLVLDVRMADMSGLTLQERLKELEFSLPVILITGHGDVPMAVQAMKNGAFDFIQKPYREQQLLDSINAALALQITTDCSFIEKELHQRLASLTEREQEILNQTLTGATSKEIARTLEISPRTVEAHRRNLMSKLRVQSAKELIVRLTPKAKNNPDPQ